MNLKNDPKIASLMHVDIVEHYSKSNGISLQESKIVISKMSFSQYLNLLEATVDIVPPSGNTISPSAPNPAPTNIKPITIGQQGKPQSVWGGKGTPVQQGMTVGLRGQNGEQIPGEVTHVDLSTNGVRVKNPVTGQEEMVSNDELEQFSSDTMAEGLSRLRQLAGISENASCGASSAGSIAVAATPMGNVHRRKQVDEMVPKEHVRDTLSKSIIGDTKPHQATGELSSNLVMRGKKTATRKNNGLR